MKKILLIDDKTIENTDNEFVGFMVDKWLSDKIVAYSDLVDISKNASDFFDWDKAGETCNPLFNIDDYEFVFIHHSQKGDNMIPSNIIDLIKLFLKDKLVLFSGSIEEHLLNVDNDNFIYRSIQRQKFWDRFNEFIKKSTTLQEWVIEILYFDYEKYLIGKIMEMLDADVPRDKINKSKELDHFFKLKYLKPGSKRFNEILNCADVNLVDELRGQ